MSSSALKLLAASGSKGEATYVDDVFSTFLYEGTGVNQVIDNGIALADEGGLVWFKKRSGSDNNCLYDTERGAGKVIFSGSTGVQLSATGAAQVTFRSAGNTGFETGTGYGGSENGNGDDICSWTFRKQPGFFDVVTYTGNATNGREIAHNLGSVPGLMIFKELGNTNYWPVYHRSLGGTKNLYLDGTAAAATWDGNFNNTAPTSTVFTLGGQNENNRNGGSYVAYLFAHDAQDFGTGSDEAIIKCGSFTTDSSAVFYENLGFEPQWVLVKMSNGSGSWNLLDTMRGFLAEGIAGGKYLRPDNANAEGTLSSADSEYVNSTGFGGNGNGVTGSANKTFVYVAIRRPHKPASEFAATDLFTLQAKSPGEGADTFIPTGFNVDTTIYRNRTTSATVLGDRLRGQSGGGDLLTNSTDEERTSNTGAFFLDHSNGVTVDFAGGHHAVSPAATDKNYIRYFFRRAEGFFDVTTYKGVDTNNTQIAHNLGVVPEMIWAKSRSDAQSWSVLTYDGTTGRQLSLNANSSGSTPPSGSIWGNGTSFVPPTSSVFTIGDYSNINTSNATYIAYLFATVNGISKVGSYTGTGNDLNVACGFSAGARFVMIKRTDSTGDWYLWDSARGIVAGNDPYTLLNDTAAEVTNTDYIDPLASGFTVTSSAPAALNNNGGTYIFYAIA